MTPVLKGITPELLRFVIGEAERGLLGANPRVGAALIAPDGAVLSHGFHRGAGTPHAEADALMRARQNGLDVRGATCVVTLEPCAHVGRTPSCAASLIEAGIARVYFAISDPHPRAAGGAGLLRSAGVEVATWDDALRGANLGDQNAHELTSAAFSLNRRWFAAKEGGRPFVTAKIAQTLDARIAGADGVSQWITGPDARAAGHRMRSIVDAIAVGTGTVLADDPALSARNPGGALQGRQPLRVVFGARDIPPDARVWGADDSLVHVRTHDLREGLCSLASDHGVEHLLIEGGPTLVTAALKHDLVDDLWVHLAPTVLGDGRASVGSLGITALSDRRDLDIVPGSVSMAGRDLLFHAHARSNAPATSSAL